MEIKYLPQIGSKAIKIGYGYWFAEMGDDYVAVCIGKCIAYSTTQPLIFIQLALGKNLELCSTEEILGDIKVGNFVVQYIFEGENINEIYCIGKVIDSSRIKAWLSQLKLMGLMNNAVNLVNPDYGYIGNWKTRKKLPCAKKFVVGGYYIKESIAYVRRETRELVSQDSLWIYKGVDKFGKYVWNEIACYFVVRGRLDEGKEHHVKKQYSDLVEFNPRDWKTRKGDLV